VTLAAGVNRLEVAPGPLAVDDLRLYSPAPQPVAAAASTSAVTDPGTAGRGSYDHVRVSVSAPSWLVLGEGYDRGWRATCNGRSLGAPTPIDGYANGWPVTAGCQNVTFTFGPNRLAVIGYLISGVTGVACLVLLGVGWRRRGVKGNGPGRATIAHTSPPAAPPSIRWPVGRALTAAVPAAVAFGFVFGIPAGIAALPVTVFVLWRGLDARRLTLAAAALLGGVVPILYVVHPGDERSGNHFGYAMGHLGAHYVAVAALGLLMLALWRSLEGRRGGVAR
jgi:hypothetical protein